MKTSLKDTSQPKTGSNQANIVTIYMESGTCLESTIEEALIALDRLERRLKFASLPHRQKELRLRIDAYRRALENHG